VGDDDLLRAWNDDPAEEDPRFSEEGGRRRSVPPIASVLIGWRFYHAYAASPSSIDHASTPVPLTLVK